jgi:UDPglucose 6-dehydrogenase
MKLFTINAVLIWVLSFSYQLQAHDKMRVAVVGTGYVGLVTGAGLAEFGHSVVCADIDPRKIDALEQGIIPIYEPGLQEVVARNVAQGKLAFTLDIAQAVRNAHVVFIAVGTPMNDDGSAYMRYVENVVDTISRNINGYKVIVTKSTVPIGTGAWISNLLIERGIDENLFSVVSNPEFLREGSAVQDFLHPDRVVVGVESESAKNLMLNLYKSLDQAQVPIITTSIVTSETIKYASNAFLAVKLSYINELANLCDATGADIKVVSQAMGMDKRISPLFLKPGPGFGGSCFPKDSQALVYMGQQHSVDLPVIAASLKTNELQKQIPAQKLLKLMNNQVAGKTIALLGLAFKADTDDIRYSPAITTIELLQAQGAIIKAYDPAAMMNMHAQFPNVMYCPTLEQAVTDADGVIVMTEWNEFKQMDLETIGSLMHTKILVDARNILDTQELKNLGFTFDTIGRTCSASSCNL